MNLKGLFPARTISGSFTLSILCQVLAFLFIYFYIEELALIVGQACIRSKYSSIKFKCFMHIYYVKALMF